MSYETAHSASVQYEQRHKQLDNSLENQNSREDENSTPISAADILITPLHKLHFPSSPAKKNDTAGDLISWTPPKLLAKDDTSPVKTVVKHSLTSRSPACVDKNSPAKEGKIITSVEELVEVVNSLYLEQQKINTVNLKLNCVNLIANFANVVNVNRLSQRCGQFEKELYEEKKMVNQLSDTVQDQKGTIHQLSNTVGTLQTEVIEQRDELQRTNHKYYTSLAELESTMSVHRQIIQKLESSKLKEDFVVDAFMMLSSIYCVNTRFVNFPLRFVLRIVLPSGARFIIRLLFKSMLAIFITYQCRKIAIREGFHGSVGSLTQYIMRGASYMFFNHLSRR